MHFPIPGCKDTSLADFFAVAIVVIAVDVLCGEFPVPY